MSKSTTINYSGTFLSCFFDNNTSCVHANREHTLVYLYAGRLVVVDGKQETVVNPGEWVFIPRNHRVKMNKEYTEDSQYKGISMTFKRNFLRSFYNQLDKKEIPQHIGHLPDDVFIFRFVPI